MKWFNLKKNRCPKCNKDWVFDLTAVDGLLVHSCGFRIREKRYKEIVNNMNEKDLDSFLDKQEKIREDEI